jgi:hypothetical protein
MSQDRLRQIRRGLADDVSQGDALPDLGPGPGARRSSGTGGRSGQTHRRLRPAIARRRLPVPPPSTG